MWFGFPALVLMRPFFHSVFFDVSVRPRSSREGEVSAGELELVSRFVVLRN